MIDIFFSDTLSEGDFPIPTTWLNKPEWEGRFCPPTIGTTLDEKHIFHLMGTTQQADLLESYGVLLGRSYYEFQSLHPEIAARCAEAEYELDGTIGRCKIAALPTGATVLGVFAPSKYLGVESPTGPEQPQDGIFHTQIREISQVDAGMIGMKEIVKPAAISWIKTNPNCTDYDLVAWIGAQYGEPYAGAAMAMLAIYVSGAYGKDLIAEASFEAFRDFVVATPLEELETF